MYLRVAALTEGHQIFIVIAVAFAFRLNMTNFTDRHYPARFKAFLANVEVNLKLLFNIKTPLVNTGGFNHLIGN